MKLVLPKVQRTKPIDPAPARKGAVRMSDVSPAIRKSLNQGTIEAVTLVEVLLVDHGKLLRKVAPDANRKALSAMDRTMDVKITERMRTSGRILLDHFSLDEGFSRFASHRSDTVRGWVASMIGQAEGLTLAERLSRIALFADDPNAGTREWAWMAVRPRVAAELKPAISLLVPWTADASPNIRRFATESTRPRGVWCAHIQALKDNPALALPLLDPLHNDDTKYVQDSVANWLNDAAKSDPEFVIEWCQGWLAISPSKSTERICRRAMRSIAS